MWRQREGQLCHSPTCTLHQHRFAHDGLRSPFDSTGTGHVEPWPLFADLYFVRGNDQTVVPVSELENIAFAREPYLRIARP